jgi:uncharacterized protein (TIGR00730 family)
MSRRVTVFGSASAKEGDEVYKLGVELGGLLAEAGWVVCTGGYDGTMGAVSRGAHERGAHVVGVTLAAWARFELKANPWVREEVVTDGLLARLGRLLEADAFVALPGGLGTLTEVVLAWQLLQAWELPPLPLVLMGARWRPLLEAVAEAVMLRPGDLELITLVETPAAAVEALRQFDPADAAERRKRALAQMMAARGRG